MQSEGNLDINWKNSAHSNHVLRVLKIKGRTLERVWFIS